MKIRKTLLLTLSSLLVSTASYASATQVGVINFGTCAKESKYGQEELKNFETLRSEMTTLVTDREKALQEIIAKLNNPEHRDSLSPEAEQKLQADQQALAEDYYRTKMQFQEVLTHAESKRMQVLHSQISKASKKVANEKSLPMVISEDVCFYSTPKDNITALVVEEMNKNFEKDAAATSSENAEK